MATKKTTKKAVTKSAPIKAAPAKSTFKKSESSKVAVGSNPNKATVEASSVKFRKAYAVLGIVVVLLIVLIYGLKSFLVAAIVNGRPIWRYSVVKETEKQAGKAALDNLIRNTLIEQEAAKSNVTVSDQEINDEIKKAEDSVAKQGRKMDDVLKTQGLTREDLRKLIRLDRLVNKMVGKDVKVADADVNSYIEKNKESLPQGQSVDQLKKTVSAQLKQQALNSKVQTWLASLQSKAKVKYFVQY